MDIIKKYIDVHRTSRKNTDELLWAQIWNDTSNGIEWIKDLPSFSPGRWAVGYNYLYVMTRILNEMKPHSVLDLGLGISSTLISCYFAHQQFDDGLHTIVEHNEEWIKFYLKEHSLSGNSKIVLCENEIRTIKGHRYNAYHGLKNQLKGERYSVISVDGPEGSIKYSRRDILDLLPNIICDSFIILMDDADRKGENRTVKDIKKLLKNNGIEFYCGDYSGFSNCCVIASADNKYFCTL